MLRRESAGLGVGVLAFALVHCGGRSQLGGEVPSVETGGSDTGGSGGDAGGGGAEIAGTGGHGGFGATGGFTTVGSGGSAGKGASCGTGGSGATSGSGGSAGKGASGGTGGSGGAGGSGGTGGAGGNAFVDLLPNVNRTPECYSCVNAKCDNTAGLCVRTANCMTGTACRVKSCAFDDPLVVQCVNRCYMGDIVSVLNASFAMQCVYGTCGAVCAAPVSPNNDGSLSDSTGERPIYGER